jgi:hypothetical protein
VVFSIDDNVVIQSGAVGRVFQVRSASGEGPGFRAGEQIVGVYITKPAGSVAYETIISDDGGMRAGELTRVGRSDYLVVFIDKDLEKAKSAAKVFELEGIKSKVGQNDEEGVFENTYIVAVDTKQLDKKKELGFNLSSYMVRLLSHGETKEESKDTKEPPSEEERYWIGNAEECQPYGEEDSQEGDEGDEGGDQGDEGGDQGDEGGDQGDEGGDQGDEGGDQGDEGGDQGEEGEVGEGEQKEQEKEKPGQREVPRTDEKSDVILIGRVGNALVFVETHDGQEKLMVQHIEGERKRLTKEEWDNRHYSWIEFRNDFLVAPIGAWLPLGNAEDYIFIPIEMTPTGIRAYWEPDMKVSWDIKETKYIGGNFYLIHSIEIEDKKFESGVMLVMPRMFDKGGLPMDTDSFYNLTALPVDQKFAMELFPTELKWEVTVGGVNFPYNKLGYWNRGSGLLSSFEMIPTRTIKMKTEEPEVLELYDLTSYLNPRTEVLPMLLWYPKESIVVVYEEKNGKLLSVDYYYGIDELIRIVGGA